MTTSNGPQEDERYNTQLQAFPEALEKGNLEKMIGSGEGGMIDWCNDSWKKKIGRDFNVPLYFCHIPETAVNRGISFAHINLRSGSRRYFPSRPILEKASQIMGNGAMVGPCPPPLSMHIIDVGGGIHRNAPSGQNEKLSQVGRQLTGSWASMRPPWGEREIKIERNMEFQSTCTWIPIHSPGGGILDGTHLSGPTSSLEIGRQELRDVSRRLTGEKWAGW